MNVAFYREEPSQRRVNRLARPEAAVLAGLERDVRLRPKCRGEDGGTPAPETGLGAHAPIRDTRSREKRQLTRNIHQSAAAILLDCAGRSGMG
jgi:hypothetical protein